MFLPDVAFADVIRFYWRHPHLEQAKRRDIRRQLELLGVPPHIAVVALTIIERERGAVMELPPNFEFPGMTFWVNGQLVVRWNVVAVTNEWPRNFPRAVEVWTVEDRDNLLRYEFFMPACGNLSVFIVRIATCVCPPERPVCRAK